MDVVSIGVAVPCNQIVYTNGKRGGIVLAFCKRNEGSEQRSNWVERLIGQWGSHLVIVSVFVSEHLRDVLLALFVATRRGRRGEPQRYDSFGDIAQVHASWWVCVVLGQSGLGGQRLAETIVGIRCYHLENTKYSVFFELSRLSLGLFLTGYLRGDLQPITASSCT